MIQDIVSGTTVGALYVLLALGFTVSLGIGDMVNLAHGSVVVAGMYSVFALNTEFGVSPYLAVVAATLICAVLSLVVYVLAIEPSRRSGAGHREQVVYTLVITSGLAIAFQLFFGGDLKGLASGGDVVSLAGITLSRARLVAFLVAVVVCAVFVIWLRYTTSGQLVRMTGRYTESAYAMGVPVRTVFVGVFCLGGALAGLAGGLLMTILPVSPTIGLDFLLIALIVAIAGRLSFAGIAVVGLAYGIVQAVLSNRIGGSNTALVVFVAFLAVLAAQKLFVGRLAARRA
ncbi:MAG TPA: branched-chain amino acid ABC transporter permease [Pseudonocardiaceae bacterium]